MSTYINRKLEEFNNYIKGKKVAIIGLGVSNIPLIDELYKLGANITLFNNKDVENLDKTILDKIYEYKLKFFFGENYLNKLVGFDVIFRSPSCRPDTPQIEAEVKRGALLTSEIELVLEMCPGTTIGITGSDGKTTTTSLIYQILKEQGLNWNPIIHENKRNETRRLCCVRTKQFSINDNESKPTDCGNYKCYTKSLRYT